VSAADWIALIRQFWPMLVTAAALGIAAGIVGVFVLLRREALMALAMPQIVAIGVAVGLRTVAIGARIGLSSEVWQLAPALLAAVVGLIYFVQSKRWGAGHWVLPTLYVSGLSLSILIIASRGQDLGELQKLFTGIDVAVDERDAYIAAPILVVAGIICALLWRRWLLLAQSPASAEVAGLRPARWDALFLALLTLVLLLGTSSLGTVMALVMIFLPAAIVLPWCRRIPAALIASASIALLLLAIGFVLSNVMDWPLSQSVGGSGSVVLVLSHASARLVLRR
jgi:ABC-type Mn2+/Zn2+ transport system permease subunit